MNTKMNTNTYIGLLRADGTEPDPASGYRRAVLNGPASLVPELHAVAAQIVFPDVTDPGYGTVTTVAAFPSREGGAPTDRWELPSPVTVHKGVVPVLHKGRLYMGVDIKARCVVKPGARCKSGGGRR